MGEDTKIIPQSTKVTQTTIGPKAIKDRPMNKIAGYALPILLLLAFKFYNKSDDHSDVHEQLIQICEFDEACEKAYMLKHSARGNKNVGILFLFHIF